MYNKLPEILYITKGKWYRYRFERDEINFVTPILDIDKLETFVVER